MNRQCLICDSSAVLTKDAAKGLTLLAGLLNGAIKGAQRPHEGFTPPLFSAQRSGGGRTRVLGGAEGSRRCRAVSLRRLRLPVSMLRRLVRRDDRK